MRLRYSPQAYADIADIHGYIAQHSPRAATAIVAQIRITSLLLARYPAIGRETYITGVRVFPTARVLEGELVVIHVRHGRRDAPAVDEFDGL